MSTGEMDQYARKHLQTGLLNDILNTTPLRSKYTVDDKRNIAATYLEELYNIRKSMQQREQELIFRADT